MDTHPSLSSTWGQSPGPVWWTAPRPTPDRWYTCTRGTVHRTPHYASDQCINSPTSPWALLFLHHTTKVRVFREMGNVIKHREGQERKGTIKLPNYLPATPLCLSKALLLSNLHRHHFTGDLKDLCQQQLWEAKPVNGLTLRGLGAYIFLDQGICGLCVKAESVLQWLQIRALLQKGLLETITTRVEILLEGKKD